MLSILSPDPWHLVWQNYPNRVSAFAITILPPFLIGRLTGSADAATAAYSLVMGALPLASLLLTARIAGRDSPILGACAVSTLLTALCVTFFPTEMWLVHAGFWPFAAFMLTPAASAAALLLPALVLVFAHEAAMPPVACLIAAAALHRRDLRLVPVLAAVVLLPIVVKLGVPVPENEIARTVHANALLFFSPNYLSNTMFDRAAIAGLAGGIVVLALGASHRRIAMASAIGIAAAFILTMILWPGELHMLRRYLARTLVFAGLMASAAGILGAVALARFAPHLHLSLARLAGRHARPAMAGVAVAICVAAGGHAIETVRFLVNWSELRDQLAQDRLAPAEIPRDYITEGPNGLIRNGQGSSRMPAWAVAWTWGVPFQWAVASAPVSRGAIPFAPEAPFTPIPCASMTGLLAGGSLLVPERLAMLRRYVCEIEALRDIDRLPH